MQLAHGVFVQQKQTISITAKVIQSINLLQYGCDELQEFIRHQAEVNPLIKVETDGDEIAAVPCDELADRADAGAVAAGPANETPRDEENPGWRERGLGAGRSSGAPMGKAKSAGNLNPSLEDYTPSKVSLREHLLMQNALAFCDPVDLLVGAEIVESIDQDGYMRRDLGDVADMLGVSGERVLGVLRTIQTFEPTGVGARDLAECLRLQLDEQGRLTRAMSALLDNLELLANCEIEKLGRICKVGSGEIFEMQAAIRKLDPRPGRQYDCELTQLALPDVVVDRRADGTYVVELNTSLMSRVLIDRQYYAEVTAMPLGQQETRYVSDCLKSAHWLERNLDKRAQTILRVSSAIVARQRDFFEKGVEFLVPLSLKDIATELDIHESTVCRATSNKYMMTHRGMFELKSFFINAISANGGGDEVSTERVRHRIRQLIIAEPADAILSDQDIMRELQDEGIDIARRTVAKYREMMNIPTSVKRKRLRRVEVLRLEEASGVEVA
ncbi:RNA polymerase factor sigma-54 [Chelativorans alearense]|uniref:RNA polymerase factor sigma-54 n=1 Tax=Chelativorans alearense TaxID=2681495 RepID=UPI0013D57A5C|nr:RNA polymerase factor sigma-54 [Chelativorans alearense]